VQATVVVPEPVQPAPAAIGDESLTRIPPLVTLNPIVSLPGAPTTTTPGSGPLESAITEGVGPLARD
jgi:hypothetical protein